MKDDIEYVFKDEAEYPNLILISPNGTRYKVTIDDAGVLKITVE